MAPGGAQIHNEESGKRRQGQALHRRPGNPAHDQQSAAERQQAKGTQRDQDDDEPAHGVVETGADAQRSTRHSPSWAVT